MVTDSKEPTTLSIVIPCYNEEAVLPLSISKISETLQVLTDERLVSNQSFLLFVNDGSKDKTWEIINEYHRRNPKVCGVNLAGNVGHQNALIAGLTIAKDRSDAVITIDADLQDDVNAIREMVIRFQEGNDIVYGVRANRKTDTFFKRATALGFYKIMGLLGAKSVYNHADYRLMSRRAVQQLLCFRERNLFLRGMVPLIGYKTERVFYDRAERAAGESKYPLSKMLSFALDGITSFSVKPVHMILYLGIIFILVTIAILGWVLYSWRTGQTVPGWSSMMISLWFCSGCVLIGLGVIGEYIGKIYIEVKDRPRFNIEQLLL